MGVPLDVLTVCDGDQPMMKLELLLNPIYTIQPVVQPAVSCKQAFNRLSNRFHNRVERTAVRSTGCQTGLYIRFDKHGLTTG